MIPIPTIATSTSRHVTISSDPIQIVTWYMWDALSFTSLVTLLTTHPLYNKSVERLELVAPCIGISGNHVSDATLQSLQQWILNSTSLNEVIIFTLLPQEQELALVHQLEQTCRQAHLLHGCTIRSMDDDDNDNDSDAAFPSQVQLLCDCLSPDDRAGKKRHLAMDGALLHNISKAELQQLAFDISWDRSIHILLFKDMSNEHLTVLLPKLVHQPHLHTLKITYDPNSGQRRLQDGMPLSLLPLRDLIVTTTTASSGKNPSRRPTLQRLYFGHVRFNSINTRHLLDACRQSTCLQKLELCLCQFESGTGRLWQEFVQQQRQQQPSKLSRQSSSSLRDIQFLYPIITKRKTTRATT